MAEVVDSDELLRRIQRARSFAEQEKERWRVHRGGITPDAPDAPDAPDDSREAAVRALAYEAVLRVLDEIVAPGRHPEPD
ncbi:hypothetical protein [Streptomyces sp. NPDC046985]|uniref:hypothetical protein n=1 Tax=Streptomyces sp. NPDC046985 TaxID=3155377 RepID=UPI0033C8B4C4